MTTLNKEGLSAFSSESPVEDTTHKARIADEYGSFELGRGAQRILERIEGPFAEDFIPREIIEGNLKRNMGGTFQPLKYLSGAEARDIDKRPGRRRSKKRAA